MNLVDEAITNLIQWMEKNENLGALDTDVRGIIAHVLEIGNFAADIPGYDDKNLFALYDTEPGWESATMEGRDLVWAVWEANGEASEELSRKFLKMYWNR